MTYNLKIKPTNVPGLFKDAHSNVVINTNVGEYQRVKASRTKKKNDDILREDVQQLKKDVAAIMKLLLKE